MSTRITKLNCGIMSIVAGFLLAACQGAVVEGVDIDPGSTDIPLADVYFSEELDVPYEELASAFERYEDLPVNRTNVDTRMFTVIDANQQTQYVPSVYESVTLDNLSYWIDSIPATEEVLLGAVLNTTSRLLNDAKKEGFVSEEQTRMSYYTSVIDLASSNPALWSAALGITDEELKQRTSSGDNFETIANQNGLRIEDVYGEIYLNYLISLNPEIEPIPFDRDLFNDLYSPMPGGCFGINNFSGGEVDFEYYNQLHPVSQSTACPRYENIRPCGPDECGHREIGPKGPIIVGVGGKSIKPGDGRGMKAEAGSFTTTTTPYQTPHLEIKSIGITDAVSIGNFDDACADRYMLLRIFNIDESRTITFYYDWNKNLKQDDHITNVDDQEKIEATPGNDIFVCATYYEDIVLRIEDGKQNASTGFSCEMPRATNDYMDCEK